MFTSLWKGSRNVHCWGHARVLRKVLEKQGRGNQTAAVRKFNKSNNNNGIYNNHNSFAQGDHFRKNDIQ